MKTKEIKKLMALMVASSVLSSYAAQAQTQSMVIAGQRNGNFFGQAGDINYTTYDRAILEQTLTKHFADRQNQDRQYVESVVRQIEQTIQDVLKDLNGASGLVTISNKALTGESIELLDYMSHVQSYEVMIGSLNTKIQGILLIPSALQSKEQVVIDGKVRTEMPAPLKVDLQKIQNFFEGKMGLITAKLTTLKFLIKMPNGALETISGVEFKPQDIIYSPEQLAQLRDEVQKILLAAEVGAEDKVNELNLYSREQLQAVLKTFGTSQRYRLQLNKEGKDQNLSDLEGLFWARSYMRAVYGIKLGAIAIDYKKRGLNIDFFSSSNRINFVGDFVKRDSDLREYQDAIINALVTQTSRSKEVLASETAMLDRINAAITFVKGEVALNEINVAVLKLLAADISEERMLGQVGGSKLMRQQYKNRFYKSDEIKAQLIQKEDALLGKSDASDVDADMMTADGRTLRGAFQNTSLALDGVIDSIDAARQKLAGIEKLRSMSTTAKQVDKRRRIE